MPDECGSFADGHSFTVVSGHQCLAGNPRKTSENSKSLPGVRCPAGQPGVLCVTPVPSLPPHTGHLAGRPLVCPEPLASSDAPHPAVRPGLGIWKSFTSKVLNPALHYQPRCAPTMGDFLTGGPGPPLLGNKLRISRREEPQGKVFTAEVLR